MKAILVVFHLPVKTPSSVHKEFRRRLYGEQTSSWKGKYHYRRKGLLDKIRHVLVYWGVLIIRQEDLDAVLALLNEYAAIVYVRTVLTTKDDEAKL
jgi:hypothetical protein